MTAVRAALVALVVGGLAACGAGASGVPEPPPATGTSSTVATVPVLDDGPVEPGRHRHILRVPCDDAPIDCPVGASPPPPLAIEVTVPAGWEADVGFHLIHPAKPGAVEVSESTGGPDGAGLLLGWTSWSVWLNSDPCTPVGQPDGHQTPDIPVGPSVDDFVAAVLDHPTLEVTEPIDVRLGRHQGRFFTLTGPSDLSRCDNWRPWDPGIYAQGPDTRWDVWVIDVDGFRVLIVAEYFPATPAEVRTQLRQMAESISFG